jgi:methionyl-tRNA formyltransferase
MRIVLITQNDPFYLAESIDYLAEIMPVHSQIVGCVLFGVSPFGKKLSIVDQAIDTYKTFGFQFFIYYSARFILSKFDSKKSIKTTLGNHKIPLIELNERINHKNSLELIKSYKPDLLVSIGGNQIFKQNLIDLAPQGCLNLHTALLPKYRGLMPTFWVLKNNEKETGVSVFFVDEGIDSGPILVQKKVSIGCQTQNELIKYTKKLGMESIAEAVDMLESGNYQTIPNPESEMTYFSKPKKEDVKEFYKMGKRFF